MRTADFDFELPPELIAQTPAARRDASRLLVVDRASGGLTHHQFPDLLNHLRSGDVLVLNDSRVIPARLRGSNARTGGRFEVLLLEENTPNDWWAMLRPGKRAPIGTHIRLLNHTGAPTDITAEVVAINDEGHRRLRFYFGDPSERTILKPTLAMFPLSPSEGERAGVRGSPETTSPNILHALDRLGELPLPPYIERAAGATSATDLERYQTVFAQPPGSVAAPTAGLHFTPELLAHIRALGVQIAFVTLHVGLGTFAPVKADQLSEHVMHEERFEVSEATADLVNTAKRTGHRVIAVGTTSMRVLESVAQKNDGQLVAGPGRTRIFIHPPHQFSVVDALLTNFHLPRSTLLMLVSAFAAPGELRGRELTLRAYAEAVRERYRFFSYGDAMFLQ